MSIRHFLSYVLGIPVCCGPLLPLCVTLMLPLMFRRVSEKHFKRNVLLLLVLTIVQAASFLPYLFAVHAHEGDALYRMILPLGLGVIMFVSTALYALAECVYFMRCSRSSDRTAK